MSQFQYQKDVSVYKLDELILDYDNKLVENLKKIERKIAKKRALTRIIDLICILARDGFSYFFLINLFILGSIELGDLSFMLASIGLLSAAINGVVFNANELMRDSNEMSHIRNFSNYGENFKKAMNFPRSGEDLYKIKFENVSYKYENSEKYTLENINVEINTGEKIALVGINGAGKSTLIKLLCGLCEPTSGNIYINDLDISKYKEESLFELFSVAFQDIHLLGESISENISQKSLNETDDFKVENAIKLSGLSEKINLLANKEKTMLVKSINDDATDLSGGEIQKIAIARALYKNAPIVILDEPTAALDPIAEYEIYSNFSELTKNKTSIFISHRLSSTRFCDRIILIDGGIIAEVGSHEELINMGGKYCDMFNLQAHYYKEGDVYEKN